MSNCVPLVCEYQKYSDLISTCLIKICFNFEVTILKYVEQLLFCNPTQL